MERQVHVYIPVKHKVVLAAKGLKDLVYLFNVKNMPTTSATIENDICCITLAKFEQFRRCLERWSSDESDEAIWQFLKHNTTIELQLQKADPDEPRSSHTQPYIPRLLFHKKHIAEFTHLFKKARFSHLPRV